MKRRRFIETGTTGALGLGLSGCSALGYKKVVISKPEQTPIDFTKIIPKPQGTMPMSELGTTGIKISKYGFGSHMRRDIVKYYKEREKMIRDSYDMGINFFDVYDYEGQAYQYEPMGNHLAPMINDVVISITMYPIEGRTVEQEMERDLKLFRRDYIDMVRLHAWNDTNDPEILRQNAGHRWEWWDILFRMKEKGLIRAVGVPIHNTDDLKEPLAELPIDFVILPFNFYHNWYRMQGNDFDSTIATLRKKGIGVVSMKPMLGDRLATPFHRIAAQCDETGEINYSKACLRYVINSKVKVDSTLNGMFNPFHINNNIDAFYNPAMSDEERNLLKAVRNTARINNVTHNLLPEHYKFLDKLVPDTYDDSDLYDSA
ncbi:aldo/keto reductase [Candidatus Latescibacterota bacterium]